MIKVIGRYIGMGLVLMLSANLAYAQEGFGTQQPDKSAAVDIESTKRGLLIPRVELKGTTDVTTILAPANSLLVYNVNTSQLGASPAGDPVSPGYYYWDTNRWVRFAMQDDVQEITLAGDVTGLTGDTKVVALQGVDINSTEPVANQILMFENGEWVPTSGKNLSAADGDNSITVTNGDGATLIDTKLKVAEGGITSEKIADGAVTNTKISGGGDGEILVSNASGNVVWVSQDNLLASIIDGNTTVVSGSGTAANPYIVEVKDGSINTIHLADGAVTTAKITGGAEGEVMITDANGDVIWVDQSTLTPTTTNTLEFVDNKLTSTVNGVDATVSLTEENLLSSKGITGTTIDVTGGTGATLTDVTLEVKPGTDGQVMVTGGGIATWVDQSTIVPTTTNELTSAENTMTSVVNNVTSTANIIDKVTNTITGANLVTTVNSVASPSVDISGAIQAGQNTTSVVDGTNTTVTSTINGNNTAYQVNVSKANIQGNQKTTVVEAGTGVTVGENTTDDVTTYTVAADLTNINLSGDVTGAANANTVGAIQGTPVSTTAPNLQGQVLEFDGTNWTPTIPTVDAGNVTNVKSLSAGDGSITVTDGAGATLVNTSLKVADGGIDSNHLANNAVNTDKIQGVGNNQVLITTSTGDVAWVDQNNLLASIASGNTTLVSGTGTTTDPYIVEIKDGSIDTIHLANGAVTAEKMSAATDGSNDGMVPVADAAGNVSYKKVAVENIESKNLTAWEGDPNDPNNPSAEEATIEVVEGGTDAVLVETSIKVKAESITSGHIKDKTIQPVDIANAGTDQVLVTDDAGAPTWKDADKVTPRFFYMPSVVFDTRQTGRGLTRDLYQDYVNQFQGVNPYDMAHGATGSSMSYDGGIISSDPTNRPTIAVFGKDDLVYYITYYDTDVFANLSIDSDGVLTYDIIGNASPSSYMNIVFVIK